MSSAVRKPEASRLKVIPSTVRPSRLSRRVRVSQLCKVLECEQVAAVCYRVRGGTIEFLLVQTRGSGRWTFPKGSAEPGLTHAQAAAIEAFEEAGVHGRIEESAFLRYVCRKRNGAGISERSGAKPLVVSAHLCEVSRLSPPKESGRNRTWFSVEDSKRRLRDGRKDGDGEALARVVRQAVARIRSLRSVFDVVNDFPPSEALRNDPLQRVQFEAFTLADGRGRRPSSAPQIQRRGAEPSQDGYRGKVLPCEVLQFGPSRQFNRNPRFLPPAKRVKALGAGAKSN